MRIFKLSSFPIDQISDLEALEQRLGMWHTSHIFPCRLLVQSKLFAMERPLQALRQRQRTIDLLGKKIALLIQACTAWFNDSAAPHPCTMLQALAPEEIGTLLELIGHDPLLLDVMQQVSGPDKGIHPLVWRAWHETLQSLLDRVVWRRPLLREMERFYVTLGEHHVRSATYTLITWEPPHISATSLATTLRHIYGRPVEIVDSVPPVIDCPYTEHVRYLAPNEAYSHAPFLAGLLSYDMRGVWDATTLHVLMDVPYDVAIAIDMYTYSRVRATQVAELAYTTARVAARDPHALDVRAHGVIHGAEHVLQQLTQQGLHRVQIAVLVSGATIDILEDHVAEMQHRVGIGLKFMRVKHVLGEFINFWSSTPSRCIDMPQKQRTMLSHGLGCCLGILGYHRPDNTNGILWGIDNRRMAPVFIDLFQGDQAGHTVILGKTGYGKTFLLNIVALRGALAGYRVIGVDAFRNGDRVERAALGGAVCSHLGFGQAVNILDVVYSEGECEGLTTLERGQWRVNQVQHVIGLLSLLLGNPGKTIDGKDCLTPYVFSPDERHLVDRALTELYATVTPDTPLNRMPILHDLIRLLEGLGEPESTQIARSLTLLTHQTSIGPVFNAHTTVNWDFSADITYYDVSEVEERYRPFYYALVIGAIFRFMRDPHRDRRRKTVLQIDEIGYLMQVEALGTLAATICKVARKYGIGLIAIDQNPLTFLESTNGRFIFENAVAKVAFHLDDLPAQQFGTAISDMRPEHIHYLSHADKGMCLAVVGNTIYTINVEPNAYELRMLQGS